MTRPIEIYLDTSDVSAFADLKNGRADKDTAFIYSSLISLSKTRRISIRYSAMHMIEIFKNEQDDAKYARAKMQVLDELCGSKCLKHFRLVFEAEANSDAAWTNRHEIYSDENQWFSIDIPLIDSDKMAAVLTELKTQPRNFRRLAHKPIAGLIGAHLGIGAELVATAINTKRLLAFANSVSTPEEFVNQATRELFSPQNLVRINSWKALRESRMFESFVSAAEKLQGNIRSIQNNFYEAVGPLSNPKTQSLLRETVLRPVESGYCNSSPTSKTPDGRLPKFYVDRVITLYTRAGFGSRSNKRDPQSSDFGDVLHSTYVPYVDIFRCDDFFRPIATRALPQHLKVIFPKRTELLEKLAVS